MKISIGIPFFNNESTLADAIRSVYAQSVQDWEMILVDDGSTDRSLEIATRVQDPRVRVIRGDRNRGLSARLNEIARLARGEYLARMDGDDLMHPERLARQLAVLDQQPDIDLVGTAMYSLDRFDHPRGIRGNKDPNMSPLGVLRCAPLIHPTITARTRWFRSNPYDESCHRAEDRELYTRTFQNLKFVQLRDSLYLCREERSARLDKYLASCREDRAVFRRYGPRLVGWPLTLALCVASLAKGQIYRVISSLGCESWLVRKRNTPLSEAQTRETVEILKTIAATRVPGLDDRKCRENSAENENCSPEMAAICR
jgi:glycosyltransferase involved in cell wall biosynthesis